MPIARPVERDLAMPNYRIYPLNVSGRIGGPAQFFDLQDDRAALSRAADLTSDTAGAEVWLETRLVGRVPPRSAAHASN